MKSPKTVFQKIKNRLRLALSSPILPDRKPCTAVHVTSLPPGANTGWLKSQFESYGTILRCSVIGAGSHGSQGFGMVRFETEEQARAALAMDEKFSQGVKLRVALAYVSESGIARN